jgi:hypothetical protein
VVPQSRFYTAITLLDGTTNGQEVGGYTKNATTGTNINFLIEGTGVARKVVKAVKTHILLPEYADDGMFHIIPRVRHDCFVYDNKVRGLYLHAVPLPTQS